MTAHPIFALVAGETSGDQLGAALITDLKVLFPNAHFVGVGGASMRAAGMEPWGDSQDLAVFGLFEVLAHFPRLLRTRRELADKLKHLRPDVFIGIDSPDFNLGLEQQLKSAGIATVHYVSPTVWAWRARRVHKIAKAADLVLCLFPFEPAFYRGQGVAASYVGHPMAGQIPMHTDASAARRELGLSENKPLVALLPGSRVSEVSRLSGPMIKAANLLAQEQGEIGFAAAIANPRVGAIFRNVLAAYQGPEIRLIESQARTVMAAADVVICASGTAALETMLINRPMVVAYRLASSSYWLAKTLSLVKSRFIALPNILAGEMLVPELIQNQASGQRMAEETKRWLRDKPSRENLKARFEQLHRHLLSDTKLPAANAIRDLL